MEEITNEFIVDEDMGVMPSNLHGVYAKTNELQQVERVYSTVFEEPQECDILLKHGLGDEFVHVGYYQIYDEQMCHNYKVVDGLIIECTPEDKQVELDSRTSSHEESSLKEQILQLQAVVIDMQYQNRLKEMEML